MKIPTALTRRFAGTALAAFLALPLGTPLARADDHHDHHDRHDDHHDRHDDNDRYRRGYYYSRPRTSYSISFGTGYAGRGYYYGPVGVPYYYETPGVVYYANRGAIPSQYAVAPASEAAPSLQQTVQIRLSQEGYYRGTIDGDIGPASHSAISRYQADHGLRVTGTISDSLLRSLNI